MGLNTGMAGTAVVFSPAFREHDTGDFHPEQPARIDWILSFLAEEGIDRRVTWLRPEPAPVRAIESVHSRDYRGFVESTCLSGGRSLDGGETIVSVQSYEVALLAAGAAMRAVDAVMRDGFGNAFSLARPPGHHARPGAAMGFCIFDNIAIAARYALDQYNLERVAILDWDVHHGNGTQEIFYRDPQVWFGSWHEAPLYPLTGDTDDEGIASGIGTILNCPVSAGATRADYEAAWNDHLQPALRSFAPQLILVSAGFDAHERDPLANVRLQTEDYRWLTAQVCACAAELCDGHLVSVLEGGYDAVGLGSSVAAHVDALCTASR